MKKYFPQLTFIILSSCLINTAHASEWALSFGANDMIVKGARPLEAAPDGDTSHTLGAQIAIHGKSDSQSAVQQSGYFKVLADRDKDELDPDHIPIWFMSEYRAKAKVASLSQNTAFNIVFDADYKGNTVSSVERQFKLFAGAGIEYDTAAFTGGIKTTAGRFALEIDDDVPKTRGYGREDLKNLEYAFSIAANARIAMGDNFNLELLAQTWQTADLWLENQLEIQLTYDSDSWAKDSTFVISATQSEYNLKNYNHEDTGAPGYLPILAWNKDLLLQAYIIIPWDI